VGIHGPAVLPRKVFRRRLPHGLELHDLCDDALADSVQSWDIRLCILLRSVAFMRTLVLALLLSATLLAQSQTEISIAGNVPRPLTLRTEDLAKMPRAKIAAYDGVWLHEILTKAGLEPGLDRAGYIVASGSDGYRAVFSLGEADPTVTETQILVADKANGQALTGRDGSFRLVVPGDIRGVRSVRQLTRLEVVLLPAPQR